MSDITNPIFQSEPKARKYLEATRWPDGPVCPHCGSYKATKLVGKAHRDGLYQCNKCREQFTVTVGTVFERSKVPLNKWLLATYLLSSSKKGISTHQLHRMLGVTYKTAWFMTHRIREAMKDNSPPPMGGKNKAVEVDETYIGGKRKFKPSDYHFDSKKGWVNHADRNLDHKQKVVTVLERDGKVISFHVKRVNAKTIRPIIFKYVDRQSNLMTDEAKYYKTLGKEFTRHETVNHSLEEYARGDITTNSVEGFFSIFKRGMKGIYQHCGEKHLFRYLSEFDFRYNHRKVNDWERTSIALKGIEGKRLTYRRVA